METQTQLLNAINKDCKSHEKVKQWYISNFPTDELGEDIDSNVSFNDVFTCLDNYNDVYKQIGVDDSLIRERVFDKLSEIMGVDYDYIYNQWLLCRR